MPGPNSPTTLLGVQTLLVELLAGYLETTSAEIQVNTPLSEYGLDSVYALTVCADVEERLGLELDPVMMWDFPTVDALSRAIVEIANSSAAPVDAQSTQPRHPRNPRSLPTQDLLREAVLPADITPTPGALPAASAPYRTALVTGATGFAGAFILRELLDRSTAQVFVLVRAQDADDAVHRVRENLTKYGLWRDNDHRRLVGVAGDLGLPGLGLSQPVYRELADQVEVIIHNGATVNFVLPYARLKSVNVLGTQEILRLACQGRIKPVHHVSSLGVIPERPGVQYFAEAELTEPADVLGGYRQTKWVSDRLVTLAGSRGLPVCVYRPGSITGAQATGVSPTDFVNALITGCIQLRSAMEFDIDVLAVPVDFCGAAIAHIALSGTRHGSVFHLPGARPLPWDELIGMVRDCGYLIRSTPYRQWYDDLTVASGHAIVPYLSLFDEDAPSAEVGVAGNEPHIATGNIDAALMGSGIECRPVDREMVSSYLDYLVRLGHLTPPFHGAGCPGPAAGLTGLGEHR